MKKAIRVVLGIVLVLVIAVIAAPFAAPWFIDLNSYKPEIADAVRDATGRELQIDGDIEYSLLPNLEFSASGITLSNAPDAANPDMLSVAKVSGKIAVFPLLGRNVEIERLVVEAPQAFLEVDQSGRPNWAFETAKSGKDGKAKAAKDGKSEKTAKAEEHDGGDDGGELPINGLHLGDVRIDQGLVSYRDATTGQSIEVTDIDVTLALADLNSAFQATGRLTLNGEPVSLDLSLDTPGSLLAGEPALAKAGLDSKQVSAAYDGSLLRLPVPGLDGTFALEIPSVGGLAAWLGRPLDEAQPDPGPLKITAAFTGDGAKVALKEARIEGEELQATASGSFDANGEVTKIALKVESGLLNIDRYLPPPGKPKARPAAGAKPEGAAGQRPARQRGDLLAAIPTEPIDLTPLRQTEADIAIDIGGIKAVGFEIGTIAVAATLKDGVLNENTEVQLYGGTVKRQSKLDASGDALTLETNVDVSKVDVGALARAASGPGGDGAPVAGVASGSLAAKTAGVSPRALVENLTASLAIDLGGVDVKDAPAGAISELKANLELPGLASPPNLTASVVYNKQRVGLEATLDPIDKILAGEAFAAKAAVSSALVKAGYDGRVLQEPVPGLDGVFDLDVPSVGKLAAWLGQPLDPAQPDPGPLKVKAAFAGDGAKVALEEATVQGTDLEVKASGSYDGSGEIAKIVLDLESGVLDIDRYLPAQPKKPAKAKAAADTEAPKEAKPAKKQAPAGGNPLAAIPDEPIDFSGLRQAEADLRIAIGGIKAAGFTLGKTAFTSQLKDGVLDADLSEMRLYGGNVKGTVKLDGSGDALAVKTDLDLAGINVGKLAAAATGEKPAVTGVASGTLNAATKGANPRALAESLSAKVALKLDGAEVADKSAGTISALDVKLDLPGLDSPSQLDGSVVYNGKKVELGATLDPINKILAGATFAAKLAVKSPLANVRYDGKVQQQPVAGLDGTLDLDTSSVGKLAAWLGQPLDKQQPDPGPLKVHAALAADGQKMALKEATIEGKALKAKATGSYDGTKAVPYIQANLNLMEADLNAYLPPREAGEAAPQKQEKAKKTEKKSQTGQQKKQAKKKAGTGGATAWSAKPIDFSGLSKANADVEVRLGKVRYGELTAKKGLLTVKLAAGVLDTVLKELTLARGSITGSAKVDASKSAAAVTYKATVDGVEALPLLKTFAGSDRLSGTMHLKTKGSTRGRSEKELVGSLNGDGNFKFLDGAVHGFNLAKTLRNAGSLGLGAASSEKTDFAELSGTFTITKGILENRDMKLLAPLVRVGGAGTVPMPPKTVDYVAEAKLVGSLEGQGGQEALKGLTIPVHVTGPWHDVQYEIDWKSVFTAAALDPKRLKLLPKNLQDSAKGLGVALPALGAGAAGAGIGGVLESVTGGDTKKSGKKDSKKSGGVLGTLQELADPKSTSKPAKAETKTTKKAKAEKKDGKGKKDKKKKKKDGKVDPLKELQNILQN